MLVALRPPRLRRTGAGPCEPSPHTGNLGTAQADQVRIDHAHAGFPQGFMTRRILRFVSLCLADECHQPNCQRNEMPSRRDTSEPGEGFGPRRLEAACPPGSPLTSSAGARLLASSPPRPSSSQLVPTPTTKVEGLHEAKVILPQKTRRSTLRPGFFSNWDRQTGRSNFSRPDSSEEQRLASALIYLESRAVKRRSNLGDGFDLREESRRGSPKSPWTQPRPNQGPLRARKAP
jgi:hypothetical protein